MDGLLLPGLLFAQGVMAGVDTVLNHELIARLPQRPEARTEIGLHVGRSSGVFSWVLTLLATAAAFWSVRDFIAWRRLRHAG